MSSIKLLLLGALALLGHGHAANFPAHEYSTDLQDNLGSHGSWRDDLQLSLDRGSYTIIVHGVKAAGKSSLISSLTGQNIAPGASTETNLYQLKLTNDGNFINIIDTPGFQNPNLESQHQCLYGIDKAIDIASDYASRAPVRRVYYMLDLAPDSDPMPNCVQKNLKVLEMAYGVSIADHVSFIISKCDMIGGRYTRTRFNEIRENIAKRYGLQNYKSVLMVSGGNRSGMRHLIFDMLRAGDNIISPPGPMHIDGLRGLWNDVKYMSHTYVMYGRREMPGMWKCERLESVMNAYDIFENKHLKPLCEYIRSFRTHFNVPFFGVSGSLADSFEAKFAELKQNHPLLLCQ